MREMKFNENQMKLTDDILIKSNSTFHMIHILSFEK